MNRTTEEPRRDLTNAKRCGDRQLFYLLVEQNRHPLYLFLKSLVRNDDVAEDALHDTIVLGAEHFHQLRDHDHFKSWLFSIAKNVVRYHGRNRFHREKALRQYKEFVKSPLRERHASSDPVWNILEEERLQQAMEFVDSLPEPLRRVYIMRYVDRQTHVKIAESLKISAKTVSRHLKWAGKIIQNRIRDYRCGSKEKLY